MKALALVALLTLGASPPDTSLPSPYVVDASTVAYVDCGKYMGTAIHLGGGRYITAAHVADSGACKIGDKPITIESESKSGDWALISSKAELPFYVVYSCDRLVEGQSYLATGFALGNPWPVTTRVVAEHFHDGDGVSFTRGAIVAGMSGGMVSDMDGVVHAFNDQYTPDGVPLSGVVELADTPLCKKGATA